jgi:hypothetical protein
VKSIERSHAELRSVAAGEIGAQFECVLGKRNRAPKVGNFVGSKLSPRALRLLCRQSSAKLVLPESVRPLGSMQRSQN